QGQCILLESKDNCYVVDCGGFSDYATADLAAQTLRTRGVFQIDGLILTHFDYDHAGSAEALLYQIKTDHIYVPDADRDNAIRDQLEYSHSGSIVKVRKTKKLDCGIGEITIFPGESGKDGNESSLCVLFQAKKCDILITGDRNTAGERYLIDYGNLPLIDILIVGHHGADSSTSLYLLQNLQPQTAVISVGKDNQYGHPDPNVINRLKRFNCTIWRTDRDGTIVFRG
ncbi:MAG: MBL fold metallo-hydrolase, partial [Clostridia bacterium]|nr:MBL fold metallo-hydrolase [Clostridia bacterium]